MKYSLGSMQRLGGEGNNTRRERTHLPLKVIQVVGNVSYRLKNKIIEEKNAQNIQKYFKVFSGNVLVYR